MKKSILFILLISSTASYGSISEQGDRGLIYEIGEWSFISALLASNYLVERSDVWADEPLMGGPTDRKYHENSVPSSWLYIGGGLAGLGILFLPNNEGWMNSVSYRNTKGFIEAAMITMLATGITKNAVGRKRPSYDNYPADEKKDSRHSFFSGHASASFSIATYSSLYIFQHIGDTDNNVHFTGKILSSAALMGAASYTAWTRVNDNRHHVSDVVVGGMAGILISGMVYAFQNDFFPWIRSKSISGKVNFYILSDGVSNSCAAVLRY